MYLQYIMTKQGLFQEQKWLSLKLSQLKVYLGSRNRKLVNLSSMAWTHRHFLYSYHKDLELDYCWYWLSDSSTSGLMVCESLAFFKWSYKGCCQHQHWTQVQEIRRKSEEISVCNVFSFHCPRVFLAEFYLQVPRQTG